MIPRSTAEAPRAALAQPGAAQRPIACVISSLSGGGAERILSGLANRWARAGRPVTLITLDSTQSDVYPLHPATGRVALGLLRPSRGWAEGLTQSARRVVALRRALLRLRPAAVVSFMGATNVLSLMATARTGLPVFVCERTDPRAQREGGIWSMLRRALYPRAEGVVVQTESLACWARSFCARVHVIPNFVELPSATAVPGARRGPRRLISVGRLGPEKGFDLLIEAFARVAPGHPDWSLVILGEGSERARLTSLVDRLGLGPRVWMPGRVADPVPHLAAAHAFALSSRREGFPNALLEAMACGLPTVAFDCQSGPAEIIAHGRDGLLVQAGDVAGFASALDELMSNPAERERLGRNARDIAVRLSPERVGLAWDALLEAR
ncbi:MAG TPA: glycosyltransferase family 4 protein [Anaeromyxobacteraceae bacterium]|jgi:glycosyltransferase involved in cell wall biosynthesis|nr:glycosyltransferase family 4 protein [Anaeromyxobacteraceae bacterium]